MNNVKILDCTLRDGGYINNFDFGKKTIKNIIGKLSKASVDIVECGFLRQNALDENKTLFGSMDSIENVIDFKYPNTMYVAMYQYGVEMLNVDQIPDYDGSSIDGIRLTFHSHEIEQAFEIARRLMDKGYKVFIQPVGTTTYLDEDLIRLIKEVNTLQPYAFYIVDTLGIMYKNDLLRMFYLVDNNLDSRIALGFHSHNNLQLSFANAQELIQLNTKRQLIIDSSVYGMGRGAGNLTTELLAQYLNRVYGLIYDNVEILEIIDEYIKPLTLKYAWGYNSAHYLASINGCHPNYASFLLNKQTLHVQDIHAILSALDDKKKQLFDINYIGEVYSCYLDNAVDDKESLSYIKNQIKNKKIVLIAPGKSLSMLNDETIRSKYGEESYLISINFVPQNVEVDGVFISNIKRFSNFDDLVTKFENKLRIITSNIKTTNSNFFQIINYSGYLCEEQCISDNAGLMCLNMMKKIGVSEVLMVGFDGFSTDNRQNYYQDDMVLSVDEEKLLDMNIAIREKIKQLSKQMRITFLVESRYQSKGI